MSAIYFSFLSLLIVLPLALIFLFSIIVRPRSTRIPIKGRHVFITGGSSGIGLALAHCAAAEGARVSILARGMSKLEEAKKNIRLATGVEVATYSADVRDFDAIKKALEDAGAIDVLICNQGVFTPCELHKQNLSEIKFMLDVNLMGTFHLIKAALPLMKLDREKRGSASIAIMSSQAGQVGIFGYTAYSASKFGLRGLAEALQQEVIADNIYVSLIFPPDTETPGLALEEKRPELTSIIAASSGATKAEDVAKKAIAGIKNGRFIIPCNLEGLALAIATSGLSPQSSSFMAFIEVVSASILRIVALCFQWDWYSSIEKWHAQKKNEWYCFPCISPDHVLPYENLTLNLKRARNVLFRMKILPCNMNSGN